MELLTKRKVISLIVYMPRFSDSLFLAKQASKWLIVFNTGTFVTFVACHVLEYFIQLFDKDQCSIPNYIRERKLYYRFRQSCDSTNICQNRCNKSLPSYYLLQRFKTIAIGVDFVNTYYENFDNHCNKVEFCHNKSIYLLQLF